MNDHRKHPPRRAMMPGTRRLLYTAGLLVALCAAGAAGYVPLVFDSSSILYKFGAARLLLRSAQVAGVLAGFLVLFQGVLAARFHFLDKIYGLLSLYRVHRGVGSGAAALALVHPVLVLASEDLGVYRLSLEEWPKGVGALLLLSLVATVILALGRRRLGIRFDRWWLIHRLGAPFLVGLLGLHVLSVEGVFARGPQRAGFAVLLAAYGVLWAGMRLRPLLLLRRPFRVSRVDPEVRDVWTLTLVPERRSLETHLPGQFAFLRVRSKAVSGEEHPFTIASGPAENGRLRFTIRESGDWTRGVGRVEPGARALVDGPYGRFTPAVHDPSGSRIFIAGGVGVTPFLSILRDMAHRRDPVRTTLLWSNRSVEETPCLEEVVRLEEALSGLRVVWFFTRRAPEGSETSRLDRDALEREVGETCRNGALVFLCGPPPMMEAVSRSLRDMGTPRRRIVTEAFQLS